MCFYERDEFFGDSFRQDGAHIVLGPDNLDHCVCECVCVVCFIFLMVYMSDLMVYMSEVCESMCKDIEALIIETYFRSIFKQRASCEPPSPV